MRFESLVGKKFEALLELAPDAVPEVNMFIEQIFSFDIVRYLDFGIRIQRLRYYR